MEGLEIIELNINEKDKTEVRRINVQDGGESNSGNKE